MYVSNLKREKSMDGRGGCCIERYAGSGAYDMSKVDQIMLQFRPIAPKPVTGGSVSPPEKNQAGVGKNGRGRRKNVRDNAKKTGGCSRKRKSSPEEKENMVVSPVTLPLLPETPDRKISQAKGTHLASKKARNTPMWLCFSNSKNNQETANVNRSVSGLCGLDRTVVIPQPVRTVGSWVRVECVTDTWVDGSGLGCTDLERMMNLEKDTCPGFISDGQDWVTWTNGAYRKMVRREEEGGETEVWLGMKESGASVSVTMGRITCPAFTCRVRLEYTCGKEKSSLTMPCDVWRMERGGFAWRLDVKAALSLGR